MHLLFLLLLVYFILRAFCSMLHSHSAGVWHLFWFYTSENWNTQLALMYIHPTLVFSTTSLLNMGISSYKNSIYLRHLLSPHYWQPSIWAQRATQKNDLPFMNSNLYCVVFLKIHIQFVNTGVNYEAINLCRHYLSTTWSR